MSRSYWVYILSSKKNGTLYIGVTSDIVARVYQHKNPIKPCFTQKHKVNKLVYLEEFDDISYAIDREKVLKRYGRKEKIKLIVADNPEWNDLYYTLYFLDR